MATKAKSAYVCNDCGADYNKWQGQCTECNAWNTLSEIRLSVTRARWQRPASPVLPALLTVRSRPLLISLWMKFHVSVPEPVSWIWCLVVGWCPAPGVLLGGEPGAGKSTVLLQTLCKLAENHSALYVTGEESPQQIAMRANRLGLPTDKA